MDRFWSLTLFTLALGSGCAAVLLMLVGFIEYLQTGRWPELSLLDLVYDTRLVSARWFLANPWSGLLHDGLARVPVALAAVGLAPLCWWLGGLFARR